MMSTQQTARLNNSSHHIQIISRLWPQDNMSDELQPTSGQSLTQLPEWFEVPYLMNITRDMPFEYAVVMFGYIMPFLLVITIVANILIVVVLAQRHMRTPTNLVLLAMAIADLLTLLFPAPWYFYMYTLNNHWKVLYPVSACYAYYYMIEVIPAFFHTASIWLTLLLAGQR